MLRKVLFSASLLTVLSAFGPSQVEQKTTAAVSRVSEVHGSSSSRREQLCNISVKTSGHLSWTTANNPHTKMWTLTGNNFDGKYLHGGLIPQEGMEITVIAEPMRSVPDLKKLVAEHVEGDTAVKSWPVKVAESCAATLVESDSAFGPQVTYRTTAIFLPAEYSENSILYKFFLSYNADEDTLKAKSFQSAFKELVGSVSLTVQPKSCK